MKYKISQKVQPTNIAYEHIRIAPEEAQDTELQKGRLEYVLLDFKYKSLNNPRSLKSSEKIQNDTISTENQVALPIFAPLKCDFSVKKLLEILLRIYGIHVCLLNQLVTY